MFEKYNNYTHLSLCNGFVNICNIKNLLYLFRQELKVAILRKLHIVCFMKRL